MTSVGQVTVLVDNDSWILAYVTELCDQLRGKGIKVTFARNQEEIVQGDICFMLGCTRIVSEQNLAKNRHNFVVHESDLPLGKGFAPMAWQILEGANPIPICLIEATSEVDAGPIWIRDEIVLEGWELCDDWRDVQGRKTVQLCLRCVESYGTIEPCLQRGASTFYPRRTPSDSELDPAKSLEEQFHLLRVVDNARYPAFFFLNGKKYRLEISLDE